MFQMVLLSHISRHTVSTASEPHILGFCAANNSALWRTRWFLKKLFFAESRGLDGSRGAVMRVHRRCVSTPNEREQSHENILNIERYDTDMPQRWLISGF